MLQVGNFRPDCYIESEIGHVSEKRLFSRRHAERGQNIFGIDGRCGGRSSRGEAVFAVLHSRHYTFFTRTSYLDIKIRATIERGSE